MSSCCNSSTKCGQPQQQQGDTAGSPPKKCCPARNMDSTDEQQVHDSVKNYYGKEVKTKDDCQTCVNTLRDDILPRHIRDALALVHDDVTLKYYGCGPVFPEAIEGCSVLDLGSGSGTDCFALSKLVGPNGHVVGIDMTEEQLAVAKKHIDYHTEKFGYDKPNVEFRFGYIEKLGDASLKDGTFDTIISNCVVNLSPDKEAVLKEAHRVLKDGGELYFSDVYTDTHLPEDIRTHRVLWGECVSGALLWQDLYKIAKDVGFAQPRLVTAKIVDTSKFKDLLEGYQFVSSTYRLFKLPANQTEAPAARQVTYNGGILGTTEEFKFDHALTFKKGVAVAVDAELSAVLSTSRFSKYFSFGETVAAAQTVDPKVDPFPLAEPAGNSCCTK